MLEGDGVIRGITCCALMLVAEHARAQEVPLTASPSDSPTNATATASPVTVAQAFADAALPAVSRFDVSFGTSIAGGDFGTGAHSRIVSSALGVRYAIGNLRLTGSIPYMNIRTAGVILTGIDGTPVIAKGNTPGARRMTYEGIGDLTLGASYSVPAAPGGLDVEVSGRVKLPTARDSTGLSSGRTDYSIGGQIGKTLGPIAPFVSLSYRVLSDSSRYKLKNGFAGSIGASIVASANLVVLASYHFAESATRVVNDSNELFAGASLLLPGRRFRLTGFATKGLSNGAASASGGIGLALSL